MTTDNLHSRLRDLETQLHRREVRSDTGRLMALLHECFMEIGRSGVRYDRADILRELPSEAHDATIWSQDFSVSPINDELALLEYRSARLASNGGLSKFARRTSLWQHTATGWQLRFHQGTPTEAFAKRRTPR